MVRKSTPKLKVPFAMGFAVTQAECDFASSTVVNATEGDSIVWIAYPKKSSKKYKCEFNRDTGWHVLGEAGFEPVRQIAIDEDWSALRFRRTEYIRSLTRSDSMAISSEGKRRTSRDELTLGKRVCKVAETTTLPSRERERSKKLVR